MSLLFRSFPLTSLRCRPLSLLCNSFRLEPRSIPRKRPLFSVPASSNPQSQSCSSLSTAEALVPSSKLERPINCSLEWVSRTGFCGDLSVEDVGKRVRLCGWVALHRVHGGLAFLNLRDHTGLVQVRTLPDEFPDAHSTINDLRIEYVVAVEGVVRARPSESVNKKIKTGMIEVAAEHVQVLNVVKTKLPFLVTTGDDAKDSAKEEIRLSQFIIP